MSKEKKRMNSAFDFLNVLENFIKIFDFSFPQCVCGFIYGQRIMGCNIITENRHMFWAHKKDD